MGELTHDVAGSLGQIHAEELVVNVQQAIKLTGKAIPMLMDELGQMDLLVSNGVAIGSGDVTQRLCQSTDLGDHRLGQVHEIAQRGTDDVVQCDQDGQGQEGPQAATHGIDALTGIQIGHLLLLTLFVVGKAGLNILDLALHAVHTHHALLALELEGQDDQLHH